MKLNLERHLKALQDRNQNSFKSEVEQAENLLIQ